MFKVKSANKLLTYEQAINFLWYCHGINERNAGKYMEKVE